MCWCRVVRCYQVLDTNGAPPYQKLNRIGSVSKNPTLQLLDLYPQSNTHAMDLLVTLEDLWVPGLGWVDQEPTKSVFIAQTSGGVVNALNSFSEKYFSSDDCATRVCKEIEARRVLYLDAVVTKGGGHPMTFRNEFLNLSKLTTTGFLVLAVKRGDAIMSVDTWKGGDRDPSALRKEEARKLFASGAMAVVVNAEANTVMAYFNHRTPTSSGKVTLRLVEEAPPSPKRPSVEVEAEVRPSQRVLEMRRLIQDAQSALRPETWVIRQSSSAAASSCPSTAP